MQGQIATRVSRRRSRRAFAGGAIAAALGLTFFASSGNAQTALDAPLPSTVEAFDVAMKKWLGRHPKVPRASVAVTKDHRLVFAAGYGGRGGNERVTVFSLSKAVTAFCFATLIKEGRFNIDARVEPALVPLVRRFGPIADKRLTQVTFAELLAHRSGLGRVVGDNRLAPGLPALLQKKRLQTVRIEDLMPQILQLPLAANPGSQYQYSNVNYLLLGQIIASATGKSYAEACEERVLAKAGIIHASLDPVWGGIENSAGGWSLSGPEYLAFARLIRPSGADLLQPDTREWLENPVGKWINEQKTHAYTLGVFLHIIPGRKSDIFHGGGRDWMQANAAGGGIFDRRGTHFVLWEDGISWFASFDGLNGDSDPEAIGELEREMFRARRAVNSWPTKDLFASFGIGSVSVDR